MWKLIAAFAAAWVASPLTIWLLNRGAALWDRRAEKWQSTQDRADEQATKRLELAVKDSRQMVREWTRCQHLTGLLWEYVSLLKRQVIELGGSPLPVPTDLAALSVEPSHSSSSGSSSD